MFHSSFTKPCADHGPVDEPSLVSYVNPMQLPLLCERLDPYTVVLVDLMQVGWLTDKI